MNFGLYVIISKPVLRYSEIAEVCVSEKIKYLQLREKHLSDRELITIAKEIQSITKGSETKFIINDRIDICMLAETDGVHLGQDDICIEDVRCILPADRIIGLSTHNIRQAQEAISKKPDYIGFGPVYKTPTKAKPDPVVGCEKLKEVLSFSLVPVVAIGGIDHTNISNVLDVGAKNLCMVRYLMETVDFKTRLKKVKEMIRKNYDTMA